MTGRLTATGYLIHLDIFADHMTSEQHCQRTQPSSGLFSAQLEHLCCVPEWPWDSWDWLEVELHLCVTNTACQQEICQVCTVSTSALIPVRRSEML